MKKMKQVMILWVKPNDRHVDLTEAINLILDFSETIQLDGDW